MRKKLPCLGFCMLVFGVLAQAQTLTKEAKIERILELTQSESTVSKSFDQVVGMMTNQMKTMMPNQTPEQLARMQALQTKLMDLMKSRLSWAKIHPEYVRIYNKIYSDEEIDGMLAFYESPAGRGFIEKTPMLTQEILKVTQAQMGDLMPEIQRIVKESAAPKQ
jgi:hypothetical protein